MSRFYMDDGGDWIDGCDKTMRPLTPEEVMLGMDAIESEAAALGAALSAQETLRAEVRSLSACIGTIRGIMRSDLPPENISADHVERYTREVCRFTPEVKTDG